jgi:hypothetical protein
MNKLVLVLFAAVFLATANAYLITSAGRDLPTNIGAIQQPSAPGGWQYYAVFNNGSTNALTYNIASQYWIDQLVCGDGLVTQNVATYGARVQDTLVVEGAVDSCSGFRPPYYNTSINFTSNYTGFIRINGWFQRTSLVAGNYNFTLYLNKAVLFSSIKTDATNYTYSYDTLVSYGDNVSIVISNTTTTASYINLTSYISALTAANLTYPTNSSSNNTLNAFFLYEANSGDSLVNVSLFSNVSGWKAAITNSTPILSGKTNWFNTTFPNPGAYTVALQACDKTGFCNTTSNFTFFYLPTRLRIQVLNETASPVNLHFNLTISNGTNTTVYATNNQYWFNRTWLEIPTGSLTVTVGNSTFLMASRYYYPTFNETDVNFTAYLLTDSLDNEVDFTVKDYAGNLLSGYYLNVQRSFFGTDNWTTVAQAQTDYAGRAVAYLDVASNPVYRIAVYDADKVFVEAFSPVIFDASLLIATNTYGLTLITGQQVGGIIGQPLTTSASCAFDTSTAVLSCTVSGVGASSNLTVENVTASGFRQICSSSITPAAGTLSCAVPAFNGTILRYSVYVTNADGTQFLAASDTLDYTSDALNWGPVAFVLFVFLLIVLASFGQGDGPTVWMLINSAVLAGKLLNIFNVDWSYVVAFVMLSVLFLKD